MRGFASHPNRADTPPTGTPGTHKEPWGLPLAPLAWVFACAESSSFSSSCFYSLAGVPDLGAGRLPFPFRPPLPLPSRFPLLQDALPLPFALCFRLPLQPLARLRQLPGRLLDRRLGRHKLRLGGGDGRRVYGAAVLVYGTNFA